jgi:hypothetical protein
MLAVVLPIWQLMGCQVPCPKPSIAAKLLFSLAIHSAGALARQLSANGQATSPLPGTTRLHHVLQAAARRNQSRRRSTRARHLCRLSLQQLALGRWGFVWLTQIIFYGLPWLMWGDRQAVLLDVGPGASTSSAWCCTRRTSSTSRRCCWFRPMRCFCSRRWPGGCGVVTPARRPSTPRSSCGSNARSKATAMQRMKLDAGPWTANKLWRKTAKQLVWIAIGLWTGLHLRGLLHAHPHPGGRGA